MSIAEMNSPISESSDNPAHFRASPYPDEEVIAFYESELKKARVDRMPFERQWYLSLAFYMGKQWLAWTGTPDFNYAKLIEPRSQPWQVRLTINKILPRCRKEVSRLNSEKPRGFVVPSSSEDEDAAAAKAAEQIHEYISESVVRMPDLMWKVDFNTVLFGTGFIKDWWDPNQLDEFDIPGKICAESVSPFYIFVPNLEEEDIDKQDWIIHASVRSTYEVNSQYGVDLEGDSPLEHNLIEERILQASGIRQQSARKGVMVKECWVKPCRHFPDGGMFAWANGKMLIQAEGPVYSHKQFPFTRRIHIQTGKFYGMGLPEPLIPLQIEYNRSKSQLIENKNLMSRPQIIAPAGSIDPAKVNSRPGLIILYKNALGKPEVLPLQGMPSYVMQIMEGMLADIDEISSQHEVSRGQTSGGVEAATAIAYLQESDDSAINFSIRDKEGAVERLGRHFLAHAHQYWEAERTVKVVGRNDIIEAFTFTNASIEGNIDYKVVAGSAIPVSRAAKQAFIMDMATKGMIPTAEALKFVQLGDISKLYEEMQIDVRQAERENLKIAQGMQTIPVNDYDEDLVHIDTHDAYRKRQESENADQTVRDYMRYHVFTHMKQAAAKAGIVVEMNSYMDPATGQVDERALETMVMEKQANPYWVDPVTEQELRQILQQLKATGGLGLPQEAQPQGG